MLPRHIFFDLDGTLFRSEEDIRNAWYSTLTELELDCPQFEQVFRVGPSLQAMSEMLFPGMGLASKISLVFKRHYDASQLTNTVPYPGVDGWLRGLADMGHCLYTLTNKRLRPTRMLIERYGWQGLFTSVMGSDSFELSVPTKPDMLKLALKQLDIEPMHAAMVGDTPEDIAAGAFAGTFTVACDWGYATLDQLKMANPDVTIGLSDIQKNQGNKNGEEKHEHNGT